MNGAELGEVYEYAMSGVDGLIRLGCMCGSFAGWVGDTAWRQA